MTCGAALVRTGGRSSPKVRSLRIGWVLRTTWIAWLAGGREPSPGVDGKGGGDEEVAVGPVFENTGPLIPSGPVPAVAAAAGAR